jgi:hypothetical protein
MARTKNNKNSSPLKALMQETMKETPLKEYRINPQGEISMSDAISQIIEPYRHLADDYDSFHKLVTTACAAWNAVILPAKDREKMLTDMRALMPDEQTRKDFTAFVDELMLRKNKLFPHVKRMIIQFKVTDRGNDFHLAVASTLEKDHS